MTRRKLLRNHRGLLPSWLQRAHPNVGSLRSPTKHFCEAYKMTAGSGMRCRPTKTLVVRMRAAYFVRAIRSVYFLNCFSTAASTPSGPMKTVFMYRLFITFSAEGAFMPSSKAFPSLSTTALGVFFGAEMITKFSPRRVGRARGGSPRRGLVVVDAVGERTRDTLGLAASHLFDEAPAARAVDAPEPQEAEPELPAPRPRSRTIASASSITRPVKRLGFVGAASSTHSPADWP